MNLTLGMGIQAAMSAMCSWGGLINLSAGQQAVAAVLFFIIAIILHAYQAFREQERNKK